MTAPLYGEVIAEHWRRPRNQGALENPDAAHEDVNPLCGDRVRIEVKLDAQGRIAAARFRGDACMVAVASASLLTGMCQGLTAEEAAAFPQEQLLAALQAQIRPSRLACALLPLQVLRAALRGRS
jgi:nitrogen fixation NifU-like protein